MSDLDRKHDELTIAQAAARLGISPEAARKRVKRGSLKAHRTADGHWYVMLPAQSAPTRASEEPSSALGGNLEPELDAWRELARSLREEVAFLRRELESRTEELRRKDHIIATLAQKLPGLPGSEQPQDVDPFRPRRRRRWWPW